MQLLLKSISLVLRFIK